MSSSHKAAAVVVARAVQYLVTARPSELCGHRCGVSAVLLPNTFQPGYCCSMPLSTHRPPFSPATCRGPAAAALLLAGREPSQGLQSTQL